MQGTSTVITLCQEGMRLERQGKHSEAKRAYAKAWQVRASDYDACVAAHFLARLQSTPDEMLRWNKEALERANALSKDEVATLYPSLYCCMGLSYEQMGEHTEAKQYLDLASQHLHVLIQNEYGRNLRQTIDQALERIRRSDATAAAKRSVISH